MRASALKYTILSTMAGMVMVILVLMPLHALITVWGASLTGHYTLWRLWKELFLAAGLLALLYLLLADHKIRGHTLTRRLVWLILVYGLVNLVWGFVAYKRGALSLKALGYGLIVDLRFPAFFLMTWAVALRTNRLRSQWQRLILWPAVVVVGFGLLQIFVLPYNFLAHFGYGPTTIAPYETINHSLHYIRIMSTLRGANPLGAYLLVPISLLGVLILRGRRDWWHITFLAATIVVLYFSFSRSSWLGALLSLGVVLAVNLRSKQARQWLLKAACAGLIVAACLAFGLRHNPHVQNLLFHTQTGSAIKTTSDQGHASGLRAGLHDVVHRPFGAGPGSAGPASIYNNHPARIAENFYIQIGQETGWLGLALFLLINLGVGYLLWLRRGDPLACSLFASFVGLVLVNMLSHAWADDTLAYVWWGLAGIAMVPVAKKTDQTT